MVTTRSLMVGIAGVLAMALSGCADTPAGAEAPKNADVQKFCKVVLNLDPGNATTSAKALADIGTPQGIPAKAREGFEVMIDHATEDEVSQTDQEKVDAFVTYFAETCAEAAVG